MTRNIAVISGGTGGFTVLSGLKKFDCNISAIVTMADSGGSSGKLRDEYGVLPPGDIRQCLVALSTEDKAMRDLFNYRFDSGSLKGQSFGNIFLTALTKVKRNFRDAVKEASNILRIKGEVIPVTVSKINLHAVLENGTEIRGEHNIDEPEHDGSLRIQKVFLQPKAKANEDAINAIRRADAIVIGPGDLYTSIIPNILVAGIPEAIRESRAVKIFVCNLMTKYGQTYGFSVEDHINELEKYLGDGIDYVLVNVQEPPKEALEKYEKKHNVQPVLFKGGAVNKKIKIVKANLLKNGIGRVQKGDVLRRSLIRHDPDKLARQIMKLAARKPLISLFAWHGVEESA